MNTQGSLDVTDAVRALSTAARALRLYPAANPFRQQALSRAEAALEHFLTIESTLTLTVGRSGLVWRGQPVAGVPGAEEMASDLRGLSVAEVTFLAGTTADDITNLFQAISRDSAEIHRMGGLSSVLASSGVTSIRVTDLQVSALNTSILSPAENQTYEDYLRSLASDATRLTSWLNTVTQVDLGLMEDVIADIVKLLDPAERAGFVDNLASAFVTQEQESKDAVLKLALVEGNAMHGAMRDAFKRMETSQLSEAIVGGSMSANMLRLSHALTVLPLDDAKPQVVALAHDAMAARGRPEQEIRFLDRMLERRVAPTAEEPLWVTDTLTAAAIGAARVPDQDIERARAVVVTCRETVRTATVQVYFSLIDSEEDFAAFRTSVDSLAAMVPQLIERGDLALAANALAELDDRRAHMVRPWPALSEPISEAIARAAGERAMTALMAAVIEDEAQVPAARRIIAVVGEPAIAPLIESALSVGGKGLEVAEMIAGVRIVDYLHNPTLAAPTARLGPLVSRLARHGDARSQKTIDTLLMRRNVEVRRAVITALGNAATDMAWPRLVAALRDASPEIAIVAAHALGQGAPPGASQALIARLAEIDVDGAEYALGREIITSLARIPGPEVTEALQKLATRRALIKRGHFADICELAGQVLAARAGGVR